MITTNQIINFKSQLVPPCIPVVQGDTGRSIAFEMADYTIPAGATATYYVQKPSGNAVYNAAEITDGKIICNLTAQALAEVGENKLQVRVLKDEEVVTSFTAWLLVHPFEGEGAVESGTEMNIFDQAVEAAYERITKEVVWPANFYGTCQTAAATQDKTVTVQGGFILKSGAVVNVMCAFTNSASQITLNVNNTGAKAVYYRGSKVSGDMLVANGMYTFVYANSHWNLAGLNGKLLQLDDTLTVSGKAADSKATGDAVNDLKADLTDLLNSAYVTDAASGAIATFPDGADNVPVKALTVEIEPVQDLHGYDNPWPGGGGKNLLKTTLSSGTVNDVQITVNDDGTFKLNGNASSFAYLTVGKLNVDAGTSYRISPTLQLSAEYYYRVLEDDFAVWGNERVYTPSQTREVTFQFVFPSNASFNNSLQKPMIRLSTISDATFAPYSNICPISGWSQAKVTRVGKNLLDPDILTTFGATYVSSIDYATTGKIPVKPSTQYVLSFSGSVGDGRILQYDVSGNLIGSAISFTSQPYYFTTDARCVSIGFRYKFTETSGKTVADSKAQMELGSTASSYEAYQGETYTIDLSSTRYGGSLDVGTGVLTVDMRYVKSPTAVTYGISGGGVPYVDLSIGDANRGVDDGKIISSSYKRYTIATPGVSGCVKLYESALTIYDNRFTSKEQATELLENVEFCYEIKAPIIVQLTAEQVTTLLGQNCIFADCGDVSCEYRADTKKYIEKILNA